MGEVRLEVRGGDYGEAHSPKKKAGGKGVREIKKKTKKEETKQLTTMKGKKTKTEIQYTGNTKRGRKTEKPKGAPGVEKGGLKRIQKKKQFGQGKIQHTKDTGVGEKRGSAIRPIFVP